MFGFIFHAKSREQPGARTARRSQLVVESLENRSLLSFTTSISSGATDIVLGPNGTTLYWAQGDHIGSYDDATGFGGDVVVPGARFLAKTAVGADGFLYAADSDPNGGGRSDRIWRIDPVTFAGIPLTTPTPNSLPWGITAGADGNIWFTEAWSRLDGSAFSNRVGMIDVAGGTYAVTEFATPTLNSLPEGIIPGPAQTDPNSVWFIEFNTGNFGRIDLTTHAITEYDSGATGANDFGGQAGLGLATDGINLFFSEYSAVEGFDPVAHQNFGSFTTPERHDPEGMTLAADGQLYITEQIDGELVRFDPVAMQFTGEVRVPGPPSDPFLLTAGPGAPSGFPDVWLTNPLSHRVDRYEIDGMPLAPGRSGSSHHAVPLTAKNRSVLANIDRMVFVVPAAGAGGLGAGEITVASHAVRAPLQPPPETPVLVSSAASRPAFEVRFASHRARPAAPPGEWDMTRLELALTTLLWI